MGVAYRLAIQSGARASTVVTTEAITSTLAVRTRSSITVPSTRRRTPGSSRPVTSAVVDKEHRDATAAVVAHHQPPAGHSSRMPLSSTVPDEPSDTVSSRASNSRIQTSECAASSVT